MDQVSSSLKCKVFEMIYEVLSRLTDRTFCTILNDSGRLQLQIRTSNDTLDPKERICHDVKKIYTLNPS